MQNRTIIESSIEWIDLVNLISGCYQFLFTVGLSGSKKIQKMHVKGRLKCLLPIFTSFLWLTNYIEDRQPNKGGKIEEMAKIELLI